MHYSVIHFKQTRQKHILLVLAHPPTPMIHVSYFAKKRRVDHSSCKNCLLGLIFLYPLYQTKAYKSALVDFFFIQPNLSQTLQTRVVEGIVVAAFVAVACLFVC